MTDKDGKEIVLTDKGSNKYTFLMPSGKVSVSAEFAEVKSSTAFVNVPADAYYADAVLWAVKESVTTGTAATAFSPDSSCTRAQIVTFLWRLYAGK